MSNLSKKEKALYLPAIEKGFINFINDKELYWDDEKTKSFAVKFNGIINSKSSIMSNYLSLLNTHSELCTKLDDYPEYTGKIRDIKNISSFTGYVASRVKSSSHIEIGGYSLNDKYTDAYYVTGYDNLYNNYVPNPDYFEGIVISETPLEKGLTDFCVEKIGTYTIVTDDGFEKTLDSYRIVKQQEIDEYNGDDILKRELLLAFISDVESSMASLLTNGKSKDIPNIRGSEPNFNYSGYWSDKVSQMCFMNITDENGLYFISIVLGSNIHAQLLLDFIGYYDSDEQCIKYRNGICKSRTSDQLGNLSEEILYKNGKGRIYAKNSNLYWEDSIENRGKDCIFE